MFRLARTGGASGFDPVRKRYSWKLKRREITESASEITQHVRAATTPQPGMGDLQPGLLRDCAQTLRRIFDRTYVSAIGDPSLLQALGFFTEWLDPVRPDLRDPRQPRRRSDRSG